MIALDEYIRHMPKVELHVHLEGSVQPKTLLTLSRRHHVSLPAETVEGIHAWYTFRNFDHFIEIYMTISSCLRSADDIELVAREFLLNQAEQNILYSEVTFTPYNQFVNCGLGFHKQIDAVNRAREWGEKTLGTRMGLIIDIPRERSPQAGEQVATWVIDRFGDGIVGLGLGGPEQGNPAAKFKQAFHRVRDKGIPCILHAGETDGPTSIWNAIEAADPVRIGHGVRAIEDPDLLKYLRNAKLPLEVCPTSNLCLGVYPSLKGHSLPQLIQQGISLSLNSDDPPMFNTNLSAEFYSCATAFGWDRHFVRSLAADAVAMSLLPPLKRDELQLRFQREFERLDSAEV
jgi:adenosine deaminase